MSELLVVILVGAVLIGACFMFFSRKKKPVKPESTYYGPARNFEPRSVYGLQNANPYRSRGFSSQAAPQSDSTLSDMATGALLYHALSSGNSHATSSSPEPYSGGGGSFDGGGASSSWDSSSSCSSSSSDSSSSSSSSDSGGGCSSE